MCRCLVHIWHWLLKCVLLIEGQRHLQFVCHFVLLGRNVPLLPLENFQIRQTMCDKLIVTFSNMVTNDQVTVNPPESFRSTVMMFLFECLGLNVVYIVHHVVRIKNINICIIKIERQQLKFNQIARNMNHYTTMSLLILS